MCGDISRTLMRLRCSRNLFPVTKTLSNTMKWRFVLCCAILFVISHCSMQVDILYTQTFGCWSCQGAETCPDHIYCVSSMIKQLEIAAVSVETVKHFCPSESGQVLTSYTFGQNEAKHVHLAIPFNYVFWTLTYPIVFHTDFADIEKWICIDDYYFTITSYLY